MGTPPSEAPIHLKELNDQLLRSWDIYIKFFTVFLTVNIAALGLIVEKTAPGSAARWIVGITFVIQNGIAVVTGIEMARYTRRTSASLGGMGAHALTHFGDLGFWGGIGNAIGNGVIGLTWLIVIFCGAPSPAAGAT